MAQSDLEVLADRIEAAGKLWVEYKQVAARMEELKKTLKAQLSNRIEADYEAKKEKAPSEAKLDRLARGSDEYIAHVELMIENQQVAHIQFIEYEALKNLYEAKRSDMSFEKAKMGLI